MSTDESPQHTQPKNDSAKKLVMYTANIFASMLDQNEDGKIDNRRLLKSLKKHLVFAIGYDETLRPHEEAIEQRFGRYVMSMKSDSWPVNYTYRQPKVNESHLSSSGWRPANACAVWEEAYHTLTEATRRYHKDWSYEKGSKLFNLMNKDRRASKYDTEKQNMAENGNYDDQTAVNELIHQVWIFAQAGAIEKLSSNQKKILQIIDKSALNLKINNQYDGSHLYNIVKD